MTKRTVIILSDHTGLTAEAMGRSLLSQFRNFDYELIHWSFQDSKEKVLDAVSKIDAIAEDSANRPIVFSTLVDPGIRDCLKKSRGLIIDYFEAFTSILEQELDMPSTNIRGQIHGMGNANDYTHRIQAMNYALSNDDGAITRNYPNADLILLGVSRSGKTPTCLYMGMHHGVLAANYPLTDDDLEKDSLPETLQPYVKKLYGLTISADQLQRIRQERRSTGRYANLEQCEWEISQAEKLYKRYQIPYIDTTAMSIEEITTKILNAVGKKTSQQQ